MTESRRLLQHFLGALAYRTQKALRDAPDSFGDFRIAPTARTPFELVWHMTGVIGYARTFLHGGDFEPPRLASFADEVARFHDTLAALSRDFGDDSLQARITDEQFLQGPLSDAMTHAGQLAMLRRLHGSPVASENFIFAEVSAANLTPAQALPAAPDADWRPEEPPHPPGPRRRRPDDNYGVALEKPDWLALLAPLPRDVTPERKPVASAEQIANGTAGPIADWVSLSVHLSAPHGSRNVLVTLDGEGRILSAGDHVMFVSQAARLDRPIAVYDHHSVGGRYAPDGSFHGTRWLTHNEQADGTDEPVATASTPSQPSVEDVAALRALVADIVKRAS